MDSSSEEKGFKKPSSAAQTFPPELLCEIFLHCISKERDFRSRRSMRCLSQAPLSLGRICSSWRAVSITLPELWSSFALGSEDLSLVDIEKDLVATSHWISKSDSRPLSILIHYPNRTYRHIALLRLLLESVVSESGRWKEVTVTVPSRFEKIIMAPFRVGTLPQLVEFDGTGSERGSAMFVPWSAPRLQVFLYSGNGIRVDFARGPHGIKRIGIYDSEENGISLFDLFICFIHCPMLENLAIPILHDEWHPSRTLPDELPSIIELRHLTHLYLDFASEIDPCRLFDQLCLPALICLELIMSLDFTDDPDWRHVQTMLARSRPPLQALILWSVPMTEETLVECLQCIPNLNELEIHGRVYSDRIIDALTVDEAAAEGSRSLCPWLETVTLEEKCKFSGRTLTGMIVSRRRNAKNSCFTRGNALKFLKCRFPFSHIRSNPEIAECLKDGLVLGP